MQEVISYSYPCLIFIKFLICLDHSHHSHQILRPLRLTILSGKDGQCWHLLGQAIRIGYSIGFHRKIVISNPNEDSGNQVDRQLHSRVWWACYALEKSMQLETGRPSAIEITDCDQPLPDKTSGLDPCFIRWVSLSLLVGKISEHIFQRRAETALEFLSGISELDQALVDWLDEASEDAKANQNASKSSEERSFAVFLSLQFHQVSLSYPYDTSVTNASPSGSNHSSTSISPLPRGLFQQRSAKA